MQHAPHRPVALGCSLQIVGPDDAGFRRSCADHLAKIGRHTQLRGEASRARRPVIARGGLIFNKDGEALDVHYFAKSIDQRIEQRIECGRR